MSVRQLLKPYHQLLLLIIYMYLIHTTNDCGMTYMHILITSEMLRGFNWLITLI